MTPGRAEQRADPLEGVGGGAGGGSAAEVSKVFQLEGWVALQGFGSLHQKHLYG